MPSGDIGVTAIRSARALRFVSYRLALVTGNHEPIARRKVARASIGHFFAIGPYSAEALADFASA